MAAEPLLPGQQESLQGPPVAVLTGTNRGIGLELCRQLLQRGWRVVALCRASSPELDALSSGPGGAAEQQQRSPPAEGAAAAAAAAGSLVVVPGVDVASDACIPLIQAALRGASVGLVVASAGVLGVDTCAELDTAEMARQFQVNALGPLRVVHAARPHLAPHAAKVALLSSKMGSLALTRQGGAAGSAAYRMSKAAANMAGTLLALELRAVGVPVLLLHPGAVITGMFHDYWRQAGQGGRAPSAHAALSVQDGAAAILQRIDELSLETSGRFLQAATGEELPW